MSRNCHLKSRFYGLSGEIMGSIICFCLELYRLVNAVELFCQDCELDRTEVSEETAGNRNGCFEKEIGTIRRE